jgi:hypothetical protein
VLYCEDFEDGLAQDWRFSDFRGAPSSGWKVNQEGGDYLLAGAGHQWAVLDNHSWGDYRVRFRLKLRQGAIHLNYRLGEASRYYVGFSQDSLTLTRQRGEVFSDLTSTEARHDLNVWHPVEIVGRGDRLQVIVDGKLEVDFTDPDRLSEGTIAFETLDDSAAQVDDIEVLPAGP